MARRCDPRVETALWRVATDVGRIESNVWRLSLVNGAVVPLRAQAVDGWIELTTPLPRIARLDGDPLEWLRFNARLGGSLRAARALGDPALHLRTEVSVEAGDEEKEEEGTLDDRVGAACGQMRDAWHLLLPGVRELRPLPPVDLPALRGRVTGTDSMAGRDSMAGIERLCTEAGWPCTVRSLGDLRVDIATRAGAFGARVDVLGGDAGRIVVELAELTGQSATCQRAVAMCLLTLSSAVRSVKGVLIERDGSDVAAIASPIDGHTVQSLDQALSAAAVACQLSGREVQALGDERLASEYLALWDSAHRRGSPTTEEDDTCLQLL